ncbi:MAG TPA: radical SAM peptide maturase [Phycisphaerae bacterium]|nr:radical SAM peptide maturase [Phycisphaerae bacterium]HRY70888.1 radical SAM peptide maturase [Phycisphaerae bacterium]HSA30107.1 radical SAM peptide maturase [Phycisphaerae bacterium]
MQSLVAFQTKSGNRYVYDRRTKRLLLCHPLLYLMAELDRRGIDVSEWSKASRELPFEIGVSPADFDDSEILYYAEEWLLLKRNDMFAPIDDRARLSRRLTEEDVAHSLANTHHICFETTEACNLNCKYCSYGQFYAGFDGRKNKQLDPETAKRLLHALETRWKSPQNTNPDRRIRLSFFGGEPLVNAAFIKEVVRHARASEFLRDRLVFSMTTNGTLLMRNMDFLVSNNFSILVSLDGDRRNDSYRVYHDGRSSFDDVMRNLETLRAEHPTYFEENVRFNAVMHDRNSVAEVHQFYRERFGKFPALSALDTSNLQQSKRNEFYKMYLDVARSFAENENRSEIEQDLHTNLPSTNRLMRFVNAQLEFSVPNYQDLVWPNNESKVLPTGTCIPFSRKLYVTASGKILPCERIPHAFAFGRVTEGHLDLDCRSIADHYNKLYDEMTKLCARCYKANTCGQCLFKQMGPDGPKCRRFMDYDRYAQHLSEVVSDVEDRPEFYSEAMDTVVI